MSLGWQGAWVTRTRPASKKTAAQHAAPMAAEITPVTEFTWLSAIASTKAESPQSKTNPASIQTIDW